MFASPHHDRSTNRRTALLRRTTDRAGRVGGVGHDAHFSRGPRTSKPKRPLSPGYPRSWPGSVFAPKDATVGKLCPFLPEREFFWHWVGFHLIYVGESAWFCKPHWVPASGNAVSPQLGRAGGKLTNISAESMLVENITNEKTTRFVSLMGIHDRRLFSYILSFLGAALRGRGGTGPAGAGATWQQFDEYDPEKDFGNGRGRRALFDPGLLQNRFHEPHSLQHASSPSKTLRTKSAAFPSNRATTGTWPCTSALENWTTPNGPVYGCRYYSTGETLREIAGQIGRSYHAVRHSVLRTRLALAECVERSAAGGCVMSREGRYRSVARAGLPVDRALLAGRDSSDEMASWSNIPNGGGEAVAAFCLNTSRAVDGGAGDGPRCWRVAKTTDQPVIANQRGRAIAGGGDFRRADSRLLYLRPRQAGRPGWERWQPPSSWGWASIP